MKYGKQPEAAPAEEAKPAAQETPEERAKRWAAAKEEFRDLYSSENSELMQKRLGESKQAQATLAKLAPLLEQTAKKYGKDATDIDGIMAAYTDDDSLYEEEAAKAQAAAKALFAQGGANAENMPTTTLEDADFTDGKILVIDMLIKSKLCASKSEARRLIQQGGVFVGDEKVASLEGTVDASALEGDGVILRKGKKTYHKFVK